MSKGGKSFDASKYVRKNLNAETVTKLKEVFDVFDYDGSGNISFVELVNTIKALNLQDQAGQILVRLVDGQFRITTRPNRSLDETAKPFFGRDWPAWLTGAVFDLDRRPVPDV